MGYIQEAGENHVNKDVEEALRSKMKNKAQQECYDLWSKLAECSNRGIMPVGWRCGQHMKKFGECFHQFTNDDVLEEMKRDYLRQQDGKAPAKV